MERSAVIFDIDGPLLDFTEAEELVYFEPFERRYGLTGLSSDWETYAIRNDLEIYREIISTHLGRPLSDSDLWSLAEDYFQALRDGYASGRLKVVAVDGALELLERLSAVKGLVLGTATANFLEVARQRLLIAGMWRHVEAYPGAAEGGGSKSRILERVLDELWADHRISRSRIVFLGDNLNDLEAARSNGVHFIGFHVAPERRERLRRAGAELVLGDHEATWTNIQEILGLSKAD